VAPVVLRAIRSPAAAGFAGILVLAAILEAAIRLGWVNGQIIALPSEAIGAVPQLYEDEDIVSNFLVTLGMTGAAAALAVAAGVPLGYLLYRHRTLGEAYEGWLAAAFAAPLVLLYPLFLVIFGRTYLTLIIMGFIPGAIPIAIQTRQGLLSVPRTLVNVGRSFHLGPRAMFWKIMFPHAVPSIFNGVRLGVMYSLVNVVAIEYLTDFGGLGRVVSNTYFRYEIPGTYAAILFVIAVSVLFFWGFNRIERWLRPV
jgi:ABC-type nitrate/sulfonate/bicarbonate transport system permease component